MEFAPEPVLDAFTPPPTRQAPRAEAPDDNGRTFEEHLDAVNETAPERPARAQIETKDETAQVEAKPVEDADATEDAIDVEAGLLGGPLPPAPPPMAAPVVVQIAASQPQQTPPQNTDADAAPVTPPGATAPAAPLLQADVAAAEPAAAPSAPAADKNERIEAKPAATPETQPAPSPQQTGSAPPAAPQTTAPQQAAAPVAVEDLPPALRDAVAATIAPAPQVVTQTVQRTAKTAAQTEDAKAAASAPDGKPEAPAPNNSARANTPRASNGGNVVIDVAAPVLQPQSAAADTTQIAQSNAVTTTASQASTHVQQAAVDTGAQRAAPAAAQVSREIIRRFDGGNTSFELRLDPAELGRVEVRMEVTRDHRVTAVITADNPQALTELARNARDLEQQLQSAGLQLSENGLSFDLRQGGQGGDADEANNGARGAAEETLTEQQPAPVARPIGYERWRGVRVDMMV